MPCSIDGCEKPAEKRGWCAMHYRRWQRHGDPLANSRPTLVVGTPEERFWPKVDKSGECWLWIANKLPNGYGQFGRGGRSGGLVLAHRFSYELAKGPIPDGLVIDHLCRTPQCVRPDHLDAVTQQENNARNPDTQFKKNAAKTHCKHGHPFDDANTYIRQKANGRLQRVCRICVREAQSKHRGRSPNS